MKSNSGFPRVSGCVSRLVVFRLIDLPGNGESAP